MGDDREDRLRVDGHAGLAAGALVCGQQLVVVEDDPVVHTDDRAVADRMIVRGDRGMPLGVVANVDENLGRVCRNLDLVEQRARS